MKKLAVRFLVNAVSIYAVASLVPGITYQGGWQSLAVVAVVMSLINMFVKPLLKFLSLPIEIATFGTFTILINALLLFLVSYLVPSFTISSFWFPGVSRAPLLVAPFKVPTFGTAVIGSFSIGFISTSLWWLLQ